MFVALLVLMDGVTNVHADDDDPQHPRSASGEVAAPVGITPWADVVAGRLTFAGTIDDVVGASGAALAHGVVVARAPTFVDGVVAEAAVVGQVTLFRDGAFGGTPQARKVAFDDGSYGKLTWTPLGRSAWTPMLSVVLFPLSADRVRVGWSEALTWGGDATMLAGGPTPGAKGELAFGPTYGWLATKVTRLLDEGTNDPGGFWALMGGAGLDVADVLAVEAGAAGIQRGTSPLPGTTGSPVPAFGASARVVLHRGIAANEARGDLLALGDPATGDLFVLSDDALNGRRGAYVALEYTLRGSTLAAFSGPDALVVEPSQAAALNALVRAGPVDAAVEVAARDFQSLFFDRPGFVPFRQLPQDAHLEAQWRLAASTAVHVPPIQTTFAFGADVERPASFAAATPADPLGFGGASTIVVRSPTHTELLPCRQPSQAEGVCAVAYEPRPIASARLVARVRLAEMVALLASASVGVDRNATLLQDDGRGLVVRAFDTSGPFGLPVRAGGALVVQARF